MTINGAHSTGSIRMARSCICVFHQPPPTEAMTIDKRALYLYLHKGQGKRKKKLIYICNTRRRKPIDFSIRHYFMQTCFTFEGLDDGFSYAYEIFVKISTFFVGGTHLICAFDVGIYRVFNEILKT